jgi:hypothetical protein
MGSYHHFDVAKCFRDHECNELGRKQPTLSKGELGSFSDPRVEFLRGLAFDAYQLTAQIEYEGGWFRITKFREPKFIEQLAAKTWDAVNHVEKNYKRYPSLKKKYKGTDVSGKYREIPEWNLLAAFVADNPQADPIYFQEYISSFRQTPEAAASFGVVALHMFDSAIEYSLNGDIGAAHQYVYRAEMLVKYGEGIRAMEAGDHQVKSRAKKVAKTGGEGRASKYKTLEQETIRLYLSREWDSVPSAAQEITPLIVKMSKNGAGDLLPTTTKPLQWIRAFNRARKVA